MNTVDEQFIKRLKSLLWRSGMMGLAVCIAFLTENIGVLELSPFATTMLGLVLGEVSKYINASSKTI